MEVGGTCVKTPGHRRPNAVRVTQKGHVEYQRERSCRYVTCPPNATRLGGSKSDDHWTCAGRVPSLQTRSNPQTHEIPASALAGMSHAHPALRGWLRVRAMTTGRVRGRGGRGGRGEGTHGIEQLVAEVFHQRGLASLQHIQVALAKHVQHVGGLHLAQLLRAQPTQNIALLTLTFQLQNGEDNHQ